jgi:hypothetical protein
VVIERAQGRQVKCGERVLVAHAPHDDRRTVAVAIDGFVNPQESALGITWIAHPVASESVGHFFDHIETQLVAQPDKSLRRRIVGGADGIDVSRFHQPDVLQPMLVAGGPAHIRMLVVTGDAAQLHRLPVDAENAAKRVHLAEPNAVFPGVLDVTATNQFDSEIVERGSFRRPRRRGGHLDLQRHVAAVMPAGDRARAVSASDFATVAA